MLSFVARKLLSMLVLVVITSFVVFGSLDIAPGDPLTFLTQGRPVSPQLRAQLTSQYHLNDPFLERYGRWAGGVLTGNFGESIGFRQPVSDLIRQRVPTTLWLVGMSAVLILTVGIGMGMLAALRPGRVDDWVLVSTSIAVSTPSFVVAVGLISLFAVQLGWFPVFGAGMGVESRIHHLFLPAVALALALMSYLARTTRAAVREQLSRDHVEAATSRGLPYRLVVRKHVMRNAMIPITTVAGLTVAGLIASTAIVETAFGLNGLGGLLIQSVIAKDFPVVQAVCLILVLAFLITNTVVDILYAVLDPRVALGKRQT